MATEEKEKNEPEARTPVKTRVKEDVVDAPSPLSSEDAVITPPRPRSTAKSNKRKRGRPSEAAAAVPVTDTKCTLKAYSKVEVWECVLDGVSVMRRYVDGWLNATQLLKVAGITEKSRRTKILEACHLEGPCEKVQGGFGKYQGTWVPVDKAVEMCKQYGIMERIEPLFACECKSKGPRGNSA
ncbi:transcription regulator HTH, apses-type DNA-binding domain-containing protein [Chytriomyces sp. MP71]|nr:transcription regulator HTH, apses-type DNA-binding domain-containing protein [Chytriomyces sp. MP71]